MNIRPILVAGAALATTALFSSCVAPYDYYGAYGSGKNGYYAAPAYNSGYYASGYASGYYPGYYDYYPYYGGVGYASIGWWPSLYYGHGHHGHHGGHWGHGGHHGGGHHGGHYGHGGHHGGGRHHGGDYYAGSGSRTGGNYGTWNGGRPTTGQAVPGGNTYRPGRVQGPPSGTWAGNGGGRQVPRPGVNMAPSSSSRQNMGRAVSGGYSQRANGGGGRSSLNSNNSGRGGRFGRD